MVYCCEEKESKMQGCLFYPRPLFISYWEADIMPLFDNENRILQIEAEKEEIFQHLENPLISQPFTEDFARRFSWSTNAIEA